MWRFAYAWQGSPGLQERGLTESRRAIYPRRKINPKETFNKGTRKRSRRLACKNCGKEFYIFRNSQSKFCCFECSIIYRNKIKYEEYLNDPSKYNDRNGMGWVKKHIIKEQNYRCAICGIENVWNGKPLIFILDHINGRAHDNRRENLRLICSNCDSQLETYKSKNKNGDRAYFREHYKKSEYHKGVLERESQSK